MPDVGPMRGLPPDRSVAAEVRPGRRTTLDLSPMPMTRRKIPVSDAAVLAALEAGVSQRALAAEYGVTKTAVAEAAKRQRRLQGDVAASKHTRHLERRRAKRRGQTPHSSRAPEHGPPVSATAAPSTRKRKSGGWILRPILLDENFCAVDAGGQGGIGPAWWLDERDAARAAANDPHLQARQAEEDRQARIARLGYDPCVPGEAAAYLARRA